MKIIYQTKLLYPEILWERPVHKYKSEAGKILVVAGSRGNQGKVLLLCEAIFRSGTGILTLAFPEELKVSYSGILPSEMTLALPQTHSGSIARTAKEKILEQLGAVDLVLIGPGLSTNMETVQLIWELLPLINKPLVIDDDGLKAIAYGIEAIIGKEGIEGVNKYFRELKAKIIITPTVSDLVQILDALGQEKSICKLGYIKNNLPEILSIVHENLGVNVVLKDDESVIYNGTKLIVNKVSGIHGKPSNNDVLAGIVASFVAQNPSKPFKASTVALFLNSLANKIALSENEGDYVNSNQIVQALTRVIKEVESKDN